MARGIDFIIEVNTGTDASPIWTKVAGQRGGKLTRGTDDLDLTSKDGSGWEDSDYGNLSWGIESDGLLTEGDAGYLALENAYMNRQKIKVHMKTAGGSKYEGKVLIQDFPIDAPHDDLVTYEVKLKGCGPLSKL
jgi:TP901-1 family phage major tail protein